MPLPRDKRPSSGLFEQKLYHSKSNEWMAVAAKEARRARQVEEEFAKIGIEALGVITSLISSHQLTTFPTPEEKKLIDKLKAAVAYVEDVVEPNAPDPWKGQ